MKISKFILLAGVCFFLKIVLVKGEDKEEDYYTSLVGIQKLGRTEQGIIKSMLELRDRLETRITFVDRYLEDYQESVVPVLKNSSLQRQVRKSTRRVPIMEETEDLLKLGEIISGHPLLAFRLLRRFSKELPELMINLSENIEKEFVDSANDFASKNRVPNVEDVNGAADGLFRIQDSYAINVCDFINGKFNERETKTGLKAFDLHYVGVRALSARHYYRSIQWMNEAYQRVMYEGDTTIAKEIVIKDFQFLIEKHNEALAEFGPRSHQVFKKALTSNLTELVIPKKKKHVMEHPIYYKEDCLEDYLNFQALCRGQELQPPEMQKHRRCYAKQDTPSTLIAPIKIEVHNENPRIYQIYDLLPDSIISKIKGIASPNLIRARILGTPKDKDQKSDLRTSSSAWITENHHDLIRNIPGIIREATGLNAETGDAAEELQISSYGSIGGHYNPHLDSLFDPVHVPYLDDLDKFRGDRIATVMFYLSDVEEGGGTAFPRIGVATKPVKGSAVFWYNLKKNGDRDHLTLHGGCPVAYGNKWVANKWIRRNDQMFIRRCSLNKDE